MPDDPKITMPKFDANGNLIIPDDIDLGPAITKSATGKTVPPTVPGESIYPAPGAPTMPPAGGVGSIDAIRSLLGGVNEGANIYKALSDARKSLGADPVDVPPVDSGAIPDVGLMEKGRQEPNPAKSAHEFAAQESAGLSPDASGDYDWKSMLQALRENYAKDYGYKPNIGQILADSLARAGQIAAGDFGPTFLDTQRQRMQEMQIQHTQQDSQIVQKALELKYNQELYKLNAQLEAKVITPAQYEMQSKILAQQFWNDTHRFQATMDVIRGSNTSSPEDAAAYVATQMPGGTVSINTAGNQAATAPAGNPATGVGVGTVNPYQ